MRNGYVRCVTDCVWRQRQALNPGARIDKEPHPGRAELPCQVTQAHHPLQVRGVRMDRGGQGRGEHRHHPERG